MAVLSKKVSRSSVVSKKREITRACRLDLHEEMLVRWNVRSCHLSDNDGLGGAAATGGSVHHWHQDVFARIAEGESVHVVRYICV